MKSQIKSDESKIKEVKKNKQAEQKAINNIKKEIHNLKKQYDSKKDNINVTGYSGYILEEYIIPFTVKVLKSIRFM